MRYYFAIRDGCVDPKTGKHDDAGMTVDISEPVSDEKAVELIEKMLPCYKGRIRRITQEEYERDFGEDE